jgi:hypothetical protein
VCDNDDIDDNNNTDNDDIDDNNNTDNDATMCIQLFVIIYCNISFTINVGYGDIAFIIETSERVEPLIQGGVSLIND